MDNFMGPVISADAMRTILKYIAVGKRQGRVLQGGKATRSEEGYYIEPTVIERLPANSPVMKEEIFGPVLALAKVKTFEEGLAGANATDYGLTGAVYSHDLDHLAAARQQFFCGNLYLNRKCTGALVGGHPFGGFNMSGTDSKAGGPDYLLLFRQGQAIAEKV
jgi:1-pyrroline-5-carboxylate dehydrogenase